MSSTSSSRSTSPGRRCRSDSRGRNHKSSNRQRVQSRSCSPWRDRNDALRRKSRSFSRSSEAERRRRWRFRSSSSSYSSDSPLAKKKKKRKLSSGSSGNSESESEPASKVALARKDPRKFAAGGNATSKVAKDAKDSAKLSKRTKADALDAKSAKADAKLAKDVAKYSKHAKDTKNGRQKDASKKSHSSFESGADGKLASASSVEAQKSSKSLINLGDLGALQKSLDEERRRLKLFVIKAKQEWSESRKGGTDEQDYYQASIGEVFGPSKQFQIQERIGKGVFSSVFRCKDTSVGFEVAVKIIRSSRIMRTVSEKEVEVYRLLASKASKEDREGARHLVNLVGDTFVYRGHLCLVFDLLKCDLRFALKKYGAGKGLQLGTLQQYGQQIFMALRALRRLNLIHGDLKPDNVLMSMDKTVVKLIDFGSAMHVSEYISSTAYVQPRYYRAPEVMLGMVYDTQIDVWSLGATLFELATGKVLFAGASNNGMLKQMLDITGAFPENMRSTGTFVSKHFDSDGAFMCKDKADNGGRDMQRVLPMKCFAKPQRPVLVRLEAALAEIPAGVDADFHKDLVKRMAELISLCCKPELAKRVTPEQALVQAFFKPQVS